MADGNLDELFPPGNKGTSQGVGMITGSNGDHYVFQTPKDNNGKALTIGQKIYFDVVNGGHIENVRQESSGPIGDA